MPVQDKASVLKLQRVAAAVAAAALLGACAHPGTGSESYGRDGSSTAARHDPERAVDGGFLAERLQKLTARVRSDIEHKRIPGAVMLIARGDQVIYEEALGAQDPATGQPMEVDSIFRIYSMTKPIVSVGVMMLVEEGRLQLSDPASRYLPELRGLKVGVEARGRDGKPVLETVPAVREMTVQDLLRHTSGLTYGVFGKSLVKSEYLKAGIHTGTMSNAELVRALGRLPLAYQPGSTWEYSRSTDVLGALIERISGQPLDVWLEERILRPLAMHDTGFWVEPSKQSRLAEPFPVDPDSGQVTRLIDVKSKPVFLSGGGGMVSTARDYLRFSRMLLQGGELDGVRLLSRKTIQYMISDHLGEIRGPAYSPGAGYGFGLGFGVRTAGGESAIPGTRGDAYWGGLGGTYFWIDPREDLVAIWMMQAPGQRTHYRSLYRNMVYGAMR
jgi:CubicO group peptidase (beta-lactamase class C family)